ncbi:Protein of unknown function [Gryllus bimaculatus]|nr:Protein of unknown function [Gryllus bimaculatus]
MPPGGSESQSSSDNDSEGVRLFLHWSEQECFWIWITALKERENVIVVQVRAALLRYLLAARHPARDGAAALVRQIEARPHPGPAPEGAVTPPPLSEGRSPGGHVRDASTHLRSRHEPALLSPDLL